MSVVTQYIQILERKADGLEEVARQAVVDNLTFILHLIKDEQLGHGINAMDQVVGTYAAATEGYAKADDKASGGRYPRQPKNVGDPYNFDWFGGFKDGIYIQSKIGGFDIMSRDAKTSLLEQRYGKLLKLTEKHNRIVNQQIILPALYKNILSF